MVYIWWSKSQYQEEFTGREIFASLSGSSWKIKRGVGTDDKTYLGGLFQSVGKDGAGNDGSGRRRSGSDEYW